MNRHDRRIDNSKASVTVRLMGLITMAAMIVPLLAGMIAPAEPASAQADAAPESQGALHQQPNPNPLPPFPPIATLPPIVPIPTFPPIPTRPPVVPIPTLPPVVVIPTLPPVVPIPTYPPEPTEQPVEPTPTYPPKETEQPVLPTPGPTQQPVQLTPAGPPETGYVVIYKYTCPPEIERTSDHESLRDSCLEWIDPVEFTVKGPGYARTQFAEGNEPQKTAFLDVPVGTIVIDETVPDGYGEPIVFCGGEGDYTQLSVSGGSVRWTLDASTDASTACLFFNVGNEQRATTYSIIFTKYYCPEISNWDRSLFPTRASAGYDTKLYEALEETCHEPVGPPATLVLTNDGGFSRRVVVDEPVPGSSSAPTAYQAVAEDLPVNWLLPIEGIRIKEVTPAGYSSPYIGCYGDLWDPSPYTAGRNVSDPGELVNVRADEGDDDVVVNCDIFNVPSAGQETVTVTKYTCPPESDRTDDRSALVSVCTNPAPPGASPFGFAFTLKDSLDQRRGWYITDTSGPVSKEFIDIAAGPITIKEPALEGYGEPVVFCSADPDGGIPFERMPVTDGAISWDLDTDDSGDLECQFFNFTEDDTPPTATATTEPATTFTIIFNKYYCPEMDSWDRNLFHPPGTPSYTDLYTGLVQTCQEPPGPPVTLVLTNEGDFSRRVVVDDPIYDRSSTPIAYQAVAEDLPVGRDLPNRGVWINEVPSAGYGDPYIACYGDRYDPPQYAAYRNVGEGLRVIPRDLEGDDDIVAYCDLFNVPDSGSETVTVSGYLCPPDSARDDDQLILESSCLGPGPRIIQFGLTDSLRYNGTHYVDSSGGPAMTEFFYTSYGPITLSGRVAEDYGEPVVFCSADPDSGRPFERMPVTDGTVSWDLDSEDPGDLECRFFFFPEEDAPSPPTASTSKKGDDKDDSNRDVPKDDDDATTFTLYINKRYCPEQSTWDWSGSDYPGQDYQRAMIYSWCIRQAAPVTLYLWNDEGFSRSVVVDEFEAGWELDSTPYQFRATVEDLPRGEIHIREVLPAEFGQPYMSCRDHIRGEALHYPYTRGQDATFSVNPGRDDVVGIECTIFNIPDVGQEPVTVTKFTCPDDVDRSDNYFQLAFACQVTVDPVAFTLTDKFGAAGIQHGEDIVWAQQTTFTNVPYGPVTIAEAVPEGYGQPAAFCTNLDSDMPFERMEVTDGTVSWELDPANYDGQGCLFFNFLEENAAPTAPAAKDGDDKDDSDGDVPKNDDDGITFNIGFTKRYCPEQGEWERSDFLPPSTPTASTFTLGLISTCQEPAEPVILHLTNADGFSRLFGVDKALGPGSPRVVRGFEGEAKNLPYGEIHIRELLPLGYGPSYIWCGGNVIDPPRIQPIRTIDGAFSVVPGEPGSDRVVEVWCHIYNVPDTGQEPVTVTKFTCPDDVARSDNYVALAFACQVTVDPVAFTLTDKFGAAGIQPGEDIVWAQQTTFTNVPYGPVTIAEAVPEGYGQPAAFCTNLDSDMPFERMEVTDGTVSWELDPNNYDGQGCLFFNFPSVSGYSEPGAMSAILPPPFGGTQTRAFTRNPKIAPNRKRLYQA